MTGQLKTKVRDFVADKEVRGTGFYNTLKHDAPINPYKLYHVNPNDISTAMESFGVPKRKVAGTIRGGSWDKQAKPFIESEGKHHFFVYESFLKRFKHDADWEETNFYQAVLTEIKEGGVRWGCTSERDIKDRCRVIEQMYEDIKENGYKTQAEIQKTGAVAGGEVSRSKVYRKINGEIAICVGRSGDLIFYDGRNRLAISKLLDLETIPVIVLARHEQWQELRNQIVRGDKYLTDLPKHLRDHVDLVELV